jgi:3-methyladenine DNA glycosylase AlkD
MNFSETMKKLDKLATHDPKDLAGMARFGINVDKAWVVSLPNIQKLAKEIGRDHDLALKLWDSNVHEARLLAGYVDEPDRVTEKQMEKWVLDFDSWDICDQVVSVLFDKTAFAYPKAHQWSTRPEEFVKRAGFVLMAALSVHDKEADDALFIEFLEIIKREATDGRNFVRKAVNWALRNIGKSRNANLYSKALKTAYGILEIDSKTARWIARDAIRELENSPYILKKFGKKEL